MRKGEIRFFRFSRVFSLTQRYFFETNFYREYEAWNTIGESIGRIERNRFVKFSTIRIEKEEPSVLYVYELVSKLVSNAKFRFWCKLPFGESRESTCANGFIVQVSAKAGTVRLHALRSNCITCRSSRLPYRDEAALTVLYV